jgi:hypothetical protein
VGTGSIWYSGGNVGITGGGAVTRRLEVRGPDTAGPPADSNLKSATLLVSTGGGGYNNGGTVEFGFGAGTYGQPYFAAIKGLGQNPTNNTAGDLAFYTRNQPGDTTLTERLRITSGGNVGVGTSTPAATLDVDGYVRLARNSSAPVACDAAHDGALALTSKHQMCVCDGTNWVSTNDGTSACAFQ